MSKLVLVAVLAVAGLFGYTYAVGPLHLGAPDFYAGWTCPTLKTWWVKVPDPYPNETYMYHGYREIGGCSASVKIAAGSR